MWRVPARMRLANQSAQRLQAVFDKFSDPGLFTFNRTEIPVRMAQHEGEKLVSRSQARRVANRFERFKYVVLDFEGVTEIGWAFADELFRVFAAAHPNVRLTPINTAPPVAQMIRRAVGAKAKDDKVRPRTGIMVGAIPCGRPVMADRGRAGRDPPLQAHFFCRGDPRGRPECAVALGIGSP